MATFQVQKRAQDLQIGPAFRHITGLSDDGVVLTQSGDIGAVITGIQGDTQLEAYAVNAYTITVNLHSGSSDIAYIMSFAGTFFPVKFLLGGVDVQGTGVIQNAGERSGAKGTTTTTIVIGLAAESVKFGGIADES